MSQQNKESLETIKSPNYSKLIKLDESLSVNVDFAHWTSKMIDTFIILGIGSEDGPIDKMKTQLNNNNISEENKIILINKLHLIKNRWSTDDDVWPSSPYLIINILHTKKNRNY